MAKLVIGVNDLETMCPEVAKEWDVEKNGGRLPTQCAAHSHYSAWWICTERGHSYQATVDHRTGRNQGCPYCSGRKVLAGFNDLATTHPDIAEQWDYDKNDDTPSDVTHGSTKKRYWIGSCGHGWQATISSRVCGTSCPDCAKESRAQKSRTPRVGKSLEDMFPDITAEWHPTKNGDKKPRDFSYGSSLKAWWLCPDGHDYEMDIHARTSDGCGCPYCSGRRVLAGFNDIETTHPEIARQWHPTKNGNLKATDVSKGSMKSAWWICSFGHEWEASVADRCVSGYGCPYCNRGRHESFSEKAIAYYLSKHFHDLMMNHRPDGIGLEKSEFDIWIPSLNTAVEYDGGRWHGNVQRDIAKDEACAKHGISLIRVRDAKCPEYTSTAKIINRESDTGFATLDSAIAKVFEALGVDDDDIDSKRDVSCVFKMYGDGRVEKSLAVTHPEVAKEWHPTKNGELTPYMVYPKSGISVWWICPKGHEYEAIIANRSAGHGCWTCRNELISKQRSTPAKGCSLLEKCPLISKEWIRCNDDESRTPETIGYGSNMIVTWKCSYCGKEFERDVYHRTRRGDILGCGNCRIRIARTKPKNGRSLEESFPKVAAQWHPTKNGSMTPNDVSAGSSTEHWWLCSEGHEWKASVCNRTKGRGCPYCGNKLVLKGYNDLATTKPDLVDEWDFDKNVDISPYEVTAGSSRKVWWKCGACGHSWKTTVASRVSGCGCSKCKGMKITISKMKPDDGESLLDLYPNIASEWSDENGILKPNMVKPTSQKVARWKCKSCGCVWDQQIRYRVKSGECGCKNCRAA